MRDGAEASAIWDVGSVKSNLGHIASTPKTVKGKPIDVRSAVAETRRCAIAGAASTNIERKKETPESFRLVQLLP